jgi:6-phosphogluconolactonase
MGKNTFSAFRCRRLLAESLASETAKNLAESIKQNGRASMVVSGGSTPELFFHELSWQEIAWSLVTIVMADERWVPPEHPDSNEKFIKNKLLQNKAHNAQFFGFYNYSENAIQGCGKYRDELQNIQQPFDVVVLGMGDDGHTASLFPGAENLKQALSLDGHQMCVAVQPPQAGHERATLTLPALLNAKQIFLHIQGEKKRAAYEQALAGGPPEEMPIRAVIFQEKVPVHVYWAP